MKKQTQRPIKKDAVLVKTAPNMNRLFAFLADFFIIYLTTNAFVLLYLNLNGVPASEGLNIALISSQQRIIVSLGAIAIALFYTIAIPLLIMPASRRGQTLGKRFLGIRVIAQNGSDVTFKHLFVREFLVVILLEGSISYASSFVQTIMMETPLAILVTPLATFYLLMTISSIGLMFLHPSHRMLHDYLAKTVVVLFDQNKPLPKGTL